MGIGKIIAGLRKDGITQLYAQNNRYIPQALYKELKGRRKCSQCKRKFNHPLDIHHIIPVRKGGQSIRSNLAATCRKCHIKIHEVDKDEDETN